MTLIELDAAVQKFTNSTRINLRMFAKEDSVWHGGQDHILFEERDRPFRFFVHLRERLRVDQHLLLYPVVQQEPARIVALLSGVNVQVLRVKVGQSSLGWRHFPEHLLRFEHAIIGFLHCSDCVACGLASWLLLRV